MAKTLFVDDGITGVNHGLYHEAEVLLDIPYTISCDHPDCFFVVRNNLWNTNYDEQRVCLYRKIGEILPYQSIEGTTLISNELRNGRKLNTLYRDMLDKITGNGRL